MFRREESISIAASPEAVFQYVVDLRRHSEWGAQIWEITLVSDVAYGPGATFAATAQLRLFGQSTIRVVAEEPPVHFVYDCLDWSGHYRWSMLLVPEGTGTRLHYRVERLAGPWWVRLFQAWLIWPLGGRRYVRTGLANLKTHMEGENTTSQKMRRLAL